MYAGLELIKRAADLWQEADKNLRPAQKRYQKNQDRRASFAPILRVGNYVFLDRPPSSAWPRNVPPLKGIRNYYPGSKVPTS